MSPAPIIGTFKAASVAQHHLPHWPTWWSYQRYFLKLVMFGFVVGIDIWWTKNVLRMVWLCGSKSYFHLDNSVLITLVSTSVGNFLALVAIVARNLFPGIRGSAKDKSKKQSQS